jgi:hypothetical protein
MVTKVNIKDTYCQMAEKNKREFYLRLECGVQQLFYTEIIPFFYKHLN